MLSHEMKKWVLLVDDEEDIRNLVRDVIGLNFGDQIKVIEAENGIVATGKIGFQAFDLIITDLRMPKKEGRAFITSTRHSGLNEFCPIIVVTGFPDESLKKEFDFIHIVEKPFDQNKLTELITNQLKLGKTNKRVAAALLNAIVTATGLFIDKTLGTESKPGIARSKKRGDPVDVDFLGTVELKVDQIQNIFGIGFSNGLIEDIRKSRSYGGEDAVKTRICDAAMRAIVSYAAQEIGLPKIRNMDVEVYTREAVGKRAQNSRGLVIPFTCGDHEVVIYGSTEF